MDRRAAIRWLAATAGITCIEGLSPDEILALGRGVHARSTTDATAARRSLGHHANRTIVELAECIIPRTDTPGATDARVGEFIDRMLSDWYTPAERDRVLEGLDEIDSRSRDQFGRDFADCTEADRVALATAFDDEVSRLRRLPVAERPAGAGKPDDHWFAMIKYLTVWGYCTSEVGMRETLGHDPLPGRYEACAPI